MVVGIKNRRVVIKPEQFRIFLKKRKKREEENLGGTDTYGKSVTQR